MLLVNVPAVDLFDEDTNQFVMFRGDSFLIEHSLVSISKWESATEKPFLGKDAKTNEETIEYVRMMTISPVNDPDVYSHLTSKNLKEISNYIAAKMTATWFNDAPANNRGDIVTAEIIYYWMIALQIPMECQHWHLNRLLTVVKVLNEKNGPAKKMNRNDAAAQQRSLNDQRLAEMNTTG